MQTKLFLFVLLCCFFVSAILHAQNQILVTDKGNALQNKVLLKHYSSGELQQIKQYNPQKYNTIVYYYTKSFKVEKITCSDCKEFDPELFDVSEYERFRKKDVEFTRVFYKYGFTLTLLPIAELEYKLPIHLIQ